MRKHLAVFFSMLVLLGSATLLAGCNTMAGAGQDVSATGRAVSSGAEKLKP
jgi:predicted small secreted protein